MLTPFVIKIDKNKMHSLKSLLIARPNVRQLTTTNPYEVFRAKYEGSTIIGYTSGKIVANKEIARHLIQELLTRLLKTEDYFIIGSDEAGKGEWLGPIVVAAVGVEPERTLNLQIQGVMDSKELSVERIRELARFLRDTHFQMRHVIIAPKRFNELFAQLKDEGRTLNDLLAWGHAKVIGELYESLLPERRNIKVIIDEFDKIKTEERLRRVLDLDRIEVVQRPKAEENVAVAAASIVARDLREEYLNYLSKKLQVNLRTKTIEEAKSDEMAFQYAKISYLAKTK